MKLELLAANVGLVGMQREATGLMTRHQVAYVPDVESFFRRMSVHLTVIVRLGFSVLFVSFFFSFRFVFISSVCPSVLVL